MLARRAALSPERFDDTRDRVLALTADGSRQGAAERKELAKGLAEARDTPAACVLAAPVLRALWRDGDMESAKMLERMVDAALRADRPPPPPMRAERLRDRSTAKLLHVHERDVGSIAVHDLALLPSGKLLVALGEAGLRIMTRDGRTAGRIDAPADALVVSDHGTRAIAVARRGELHRVSRVDLIDRRAQAWWEAGLVSFARTFDGQRWLVSEGGVATLIDPLADDWSASARIEGERCVSVERVPGGAAVLLTAERDGALSRWDYDAGLTRLRRRTTIDLGFAELASPVDLACAPEPWVFGSYANASEGPAESLLVSVSNRHAWRLGGAPVPGSLSIGAGIACAATRVDAGVQVVLVASDSEKKTLLRVRLDGARACRTRIQDGTLAIGDDRGRVLVFDLETGAALRDLRIRA